jgi:hypothetical protein
VEAGCLHAVVWSVHAGVLYAEEGQFNPHAARQQRKQMKKAAKKVGPPPPKQRGEDTI